MSWRIVGEFHIILCHSSLLFSIPSLPSVILSSILFFSPLLFLSLSLTSLNYLLFSPPHFSSLLLFVSTPLPLRCLYPFSAFLSISTARTHGLYRTAPHSTVLYRTLPYYTVRRFKVLYRIPVYLYATT